MRRREFITLIGGAAAWPLAARAQQGEPAPVSVLANLVENDPEAVARLSTFRRVLQGLGWVEGRNLRIDTRWGVDIDRVRKNAAELVALAPDVILANAPPSVMALQQATQSVPIVFVGVTDPVGMVNCWVNCRLSAELTLIARDNRASNPTTDGRRRSRIADAARLCDRENPAVTGGSAQVGPIHFHNYSFVKPH